MPVLPVVIEPRAAVPKVLAQHGDEKYVLSGNGVYNPKAPQFWLQDLRDYLAGCSADFDAVLDWAERQSSEIQRAPNQGAGDFRMFDQCPVKPKPSPSPARAYACTHARAGLRLERL